MDSSPESENYLFTLMSSQTNMTFCLLWNMKLAFLRNLEVNSEQNFLVTIILQNACFVQNK